MEEIEDFTPSGLTITELTTRFLIMRDRFAKLTVKAERMEKQLEVYQNEIVLGFRERSEQAEAREKVFIDNVKLCAAGVERCFSKICPGKHVCHKHKNSVTGTEKSCHTCRYRDKNCKTFIDCNNGSGWKEIVRVEGKP